MRLFLTLFIGLSLLSCNNSDGKRDTRYLPSSVGNINSIQIIMENDLWNGSVGETLRKYFAAPTDGLPQQEPLFSMNQMAPANFSDFARSYRGFVYVKIGDKDTVSLKENSYARPQTGAFVTGTSRESLVQLIENNHERIIATLKQAELKEKQRRIKVSTLKLDSLEERLGVSLTISSAYRVALAKDDFYWLRKDLKSGSTNVIIYEVPLNTIGQDSTVIGDIITMRDSISGDKLPVEEGGRFITEEAFAPLLFTTEIDGKFAYETKGTWEVKDQWMAGPFVNYAIRDEANDRYLILEGFTYAPSVEKRNHQFELEAILKSAKFKK